MDLLFKFTIWFEGDLETQTRFVVAKDEDEAFYKIAEYSEALEENGFDKMYYYFFN